MIARVARRRSVLRDTVGASIVEFALIVPGFLMLVIGGIDAGRMLWSQVTLQRAVEAAARCAAVDTVRCGTPGQAQTFASELSLFAPPAAFAVVPAACGVSVAASFEYSLSTALLGVPNLTLTASACYPQ
jgi:uncharacterized membrane protein